MNPTAQIRALDIAAELLMENARHLRTAGVDNASNDAVRAAQQAKRLAFAIGDGLELSPAALSEAERIEAHG